MAAKGVSGILAIGVCAALLFAACGGKKTSVSEDKQKEARGHYDMAMAYIQSDRGSEAIEELDKAVELNPFDAEIHNARGIVFFHKERFEKAEDAYKKALEVNPKLSDARHNLGTMYLYLGRFDEAVNQFQEALADDTYRNQANTLNGLGWAWFKKQDYVRAEQYFKEVIDRDRRYLIAYDNLAKVYMATNRLDEAIQTLGTVLEQSPMYAEANLDMGICLLKKGDKVKAREHFLAVLKVDPLGKLGGQAQEYLGLLE